MSLERLSVASLFLPARTFTLETFLSPSPETRTFAPEIETQIDDALEFYRERGAVIVYPGHDHYPAEFFELEDPPLFLSVLGNSAQLIVRDRIAIVGSRELSHRCARWMEQELARFLRIASTAVIVSGGARGADQAAHLAAVRAGRPTIVFLPSGLGEIYPPDLNDWIEPILRAGGALVSSYAPHDTIRKYRFEGRNRLIATLCQLLFVTEASKRSGSLMTARLAAEQSKDIAVLPSFPSDLVGQGTLDLLINNAIVIRDAEDLLMALMSTSRAPLVPSSPKALSIPSSPKAPPSRNRKEAVGEPHRDERRQLTLT